MKITNFRLRIIQTEFGLRLTNIEKSAGGDSFSPCSIKDVGESLEYLCLDESNFIAPPEIKTFSDFDPHCGKEWEWGKFATGLITKESDGVYLLTWKGSETKTLPSIFEEVSSRATHCGITDFYPKHERVLRSAIQSGDPFDTHWFSSKKESHCARIIFTGREFELEVQASDDITSDIIDTTIWKIMGGNDFADCGWSAARKKYGLTDDQVGLLFDKIEENSCGPYEFDFAPINSDEGNTRFSSGKLPLGSSFEQIQSKLSELASEAQGELDGMRQDFFEILKEGLDQYVQEVLNESR